MVPRQPIRLHGKEEQEELTSEGRDLKELTPLSLRCHHQWAYRRHCRTQHLDHRRTRNAVKEQNSC
jgi:hypothetical protein